MRLWSLVPVCGIASWDNLLGLNSSPGWSPIAPLARVERVRGVRIGNRGLMPVVPRKLDEQRQVMFSLHVQHSCPPKFSARMNSFINLVNMGTSNPSSHLQYPNGRASPGKIRRNLPGQARARFRSSSCPQMGQQSYPSVDH